MRLWAPSHVPGRKFNKVSTLLSRADLTLVALAGKKKLIKLSSMIEGGKRRELRLFPLSLTYQFFRYTVCALAVWRDMLLHAKLLSLPASLSLFLLSSISISTSIPSPPAVLLSVIPRSTWEFYRYRRSCLQWHWLQWHILEPFGYSDTFLISQFPILYTRDRL